jgi:hypothetical protein
MREKKFLVPGAKSSSGRAGFTSGNGLVFRKPDIRLLSQSV